MRRGNRLSTQYKENTSQPVSRISHTLKESIDAWSENTYPVLADTTNHVKHSVPSRTTKYSTETLQEIPVQSNSKLSEIEILKRQVMYLDNETIERAANSPEFIRTEPASVMEITPLKIDNWLKTTSNGFFRSQERHATLEKKRTRIKKLRKIDVMNMNGLLTEYNTKQFKQSLVREIQEINKPLILYPLMDVMYHEEIK